MAEADLALTLEDEENGFGWPCAVTNPSGTTENFFVQSGDIHMLLETDADIPVSNRTAHVAVRIASLTARGFDIPRADPDETKNPWIFEFDDINGNVRKFTVSNSEPDRALGVVMIILELIKV